VDGADVLATIANYGRALVPVDALAARLGLDEHELGRILTDLESSGLVEPWGDSDGRGFVAMTPLAAHRLGLTLNERRRWCRAGAPQARDRLPPSNGVLRESEINGFNGNRLAHVVDAREPAPDARLTRFEESAAETLAYRNGRRRTRPGLRPRPARASRGRGPRTLRRGGRVRSVSMPP
jgi:hypothetical protein